LARQANHFRRAERWFPPPGPVLPPAARDIADELTAKGVSLSLGRGTYDPVRWLLYDHVAGRLPPPAGDQAGVREMDDGYHAACATSGPCLALKGLHELDGQAVSQSMDGEALPLVRLGPSEQPA
jgi:hypothetical protein